MRIHFLVAWLAIVLLALGTLGVVEAERPREDSCEAPQACEARVHKNWWFVVRNRCARGSSSALASVRALRKFCAHETGPAAPRSQSRDSRFPTERGAYREPRPGRRPLTRDVIAPVRLPYLVPLFYNDSSGLKADRDTCTRLHGAGPKPPGRAPQYNRSSRLKVVNLFSPHYSLQCYDAKFPETASPSKTCFVGIALDRQLLRLAPNAFFCGFAGLHHVG
jgi:hypothetical protein